MNDAPSRSPGASWRLVVGADGMPLGYLSTQWDDTDIEGQVHFPRGPVRDPVRRNRLPVTSVRSQDAPPVSGFVWRLIGDIEGLLELPSATFCTVAEMHGEVSSGAPE